MGRPLRQQEPGAFYFVTTRCLESRHLLRPDPEIRAQSGFWLGRALERSPGITLYAVLAMSNHLHMVVRDERGQLPGFMCYYLGNLARSVNAIRGRSGPVFHRRYDATRILDPRAAVHYLAYLVANPVRAGLVERHDQWPGLLLYARRTPRQIRFVDINRTGHRHSKRRAGSGSRRGARGDSVDSHASITVHPLPFESHDGAPTLLGGRALFSLDPKSHALVNSVADTPLVLDRPAARQFMSASETAYRQVLKTERDLRRAGCRVTGARKVLTQDPTRVPTQSNNSLRPLVLCDSSCANLWHAFRRAWRAFNEWYRRAANAFRGGNRRVKYPPFSMMPGGFPAL